MTRPQEPALAAIVDVILEHCDPDEIVLFGSWAKGTVHRHSDIDVLVLGSFTASRWLRGREIREALRELPIPVDLHLYTPAEFATGASKPHGYLHTIGETSRTLYRRQHLDA